MYVGFIGELYLNMLKGIIIPLVIPSLIATIGSMDIGLSSKVGLRAIVYFLSTTVLACIVGLILVKAIRPGQGEDHGDHEDMDKENVTTADTLMDLVRNLFPPNIIQATIQQRQTEIIYPGENTVSHSNFSNNL